METYVPSTTSVTIVVRFRALAMVALWRRNRDSHSFLGGGLIMLK